MIHDSREVALRKQATTTRWTKHGPDDRGTTRAGRGGLGGADEAESRLSSDTVELAHREEGGRGTLVGGRVPGNLRDLQHQFILLLGIHEETGEPALYCAEYVISTWKEPHP